MAWLLICGIGFFLFLAFYAIGLLFEKRETRIVFREARELRRYRRFGNNPMVRCFCLLSDGQMIDCFVVDWSEGGLGIFVRNDYNFRKITDFSIKSTRDCAGKWLEVRVCHVHPEAHGYFLGCQFKEPLDKEILMSYKVIPPSR